MLVPTLAHGPALLMRQEEISLAFGQAPSPSISPSGPTGHSFKMDPSAPVQTVGVGVFGPGGIPGPVLDNCLTVSAQPTQRQRDAARRATPTRACRARADRADRD